MGWKKIEINKTDVADFTKNFKKKTKFLVDENLGDSTAELLRKLGWNAKFVLEVGLEGKSDQQVFQYACRENRILLTHDNDFLHNQRFPINLTAGIIILPGASGKENTLISALAKVISIIAPFAELYERSKIIIHEDDTMAIISKNHEGVLTKDLFKIPAKGEPMVWED